MGKTSSAVKNRYNAKAYDQIMVRLPKGMKEQFQELCAANGDSMNNVLAQAAKEYIAQHQQKSPL